MGLGLGLILGSGLDLGWGLGLGTWGLGWGGVGGEAGCCLRVELRSLGASLGEAFQVAMARRAAAGGEPRLVGGQEWARSGVRARVVTGGGGGGGREGGRSLVETRRSREGVGRDLQ